MKTREWSVNVGERTEHWMSYSVGERCGMCCAITPIGAVFDYSSMKEGVRHEQVR
jgi:hypothetical protein